MTRGFEDFLSFAFTGGEPFSHKKKFKKIVDHHQPSAIIEPLSYTAGILLNHEMLSLAANQLL